MMFKPVSGQRHAEARPGFLVDLVIETLRKRFREGQYREGEKLPGEAKLAKELNVSRSTVREALRVLSQLGLVQTWTGKGSFVIRADLAPQEMVEMSVQDIRSIYRFRTVLELDAAKRLAEACSDEGKARILRASTEFQASLTRQSLEEIVHADVGLYVAILDVSGNEYGARHYEANRPEFVRATTAAVTLWERSSGADSYPKSSVQQDIVMAIMRQDVRAVSAAMRRRELELDMILKASEDRKAAASAPDQKPDTAVPSLD